MKLSVVRGSRVLTQIGLLVRMARYSTVNDWTGMETLEQDDPDVLGIIKREKDRQKRSLELIASEVIVDLLIVINNTIVLLSHTNICTIVYTVWSVY